MTCRVLLALLVGCYACADRSQAPAAAGLLTAIELPKQTVVYSAATGLVVAWGIVDLPQNSRLQAAYAMADAAARAELAAFLRVRLKDSMIDTTSGTRTHIEHSSRQSTRGRISGGTLLRQTATVRGRLLVLSRLTIHRDDIITAYPVATRAAVRAAVESLKPASEDI